MMVLFSFRLDRQFNHIVIIFLVDGDYAPSRVDYLLKSRLILRGSKRCLIAFLLMRRKEIQTVVPDWKIHVRNMTFGKRKLNTRIISNTCVIIFRLSLLLYLKKKKNMINCVHEILNMQCHRQISKPFVLTDNFKCKPILHYVQFSLVIRKFLSSFTSKYI